MSILCDLKVEFNVVWQFIIMKLCNVLQMINHFIQYKWLSNKIKTNLKMSGLDSWPNMDISRNKSILSERRTSLKFRQYHTCFTWSAYVHMRIMLIKSFQWKTRLRKIQHERENGGKLIYTAIKEVTPYLSHPRFFFFCVQLVPIQAAKDFILLMTTLIGIYSNFITVRYSIFKFSMGRELFQWWACSDEFIES